MLKLVQNNMSTVCRLKALIYKLYLSCNGSKHSILNKQKGNVIAFDRKFPSEIVVQPYANYRTRVHWVQMSVIICISSIEMSLK